MIMEMYVVYDRAVQAYLQPVFVRSRGEMLRSFPSHDRLLSFCVHCFLFNVDCMCFSVIEIWKGGICEDFLCPLPPLWILDCFL